MRTCHMAEFKRLFGAVEPYLRQALVNTDGVNNPSVNQPRVRGKKLHIMFFRLITFLHVRAIGGWSHRIIARNLSGSKLSYLFGLAESYCLLTLG